MKFLRRGNEHWWSRTGNGASGRVSWKLSSFPVTLICCRSMATMATDCFVWRALAVFRFVSSVFDGVSLSKMTLDAVGFQLFRPFSSFQFLLF